jgi:hypothetical protein
MDNIKIKVLPDRQDRFMVVIHREVNGKLEVLGIPLRDVTEAEATKMVNPLKHAFEFGVRATAAATATAINRIYYSLFK